MGSKPGGPPGGPRELQSFYSSSAAPPTSHHQSQSSLDDLTFGSLTSAPGQKSIPWDQFAANEEMFGVTTSFDEHVYTTRIDKSGPGFKEREREAQRLADEIMGAPPGPAGLNPHVAEERGLKIDDSGLGEEDR